jgi:hypothetical protein
MAETVLVMAPLMPEKIAAGEALLRRLDEDGFPVVAAFWLFFEETNHWRLILASPEAKGGDPLMIIRKINALAESLGERRLAYDVSVRKPSDYLVDQYGHQVWRGRLPKQAIFHVDCGTRYIYRFLPRRLPSR